MSEPREFWIGFGKRTKRPDCVLEYDREVYGDIHVIEKSAYDALKAENDRLKCLHKDHEDDWKRIQDTERRYDKLIQKLVDALNKIKFDRGTNAAETNANNYHIAREALKEFKSQSLVDQSQPKLSL